MTATSGSSKHGHDPHLAHHFETRKQQQEAGKLGMWIFLSTEILLFGGLFCAYAVYRANHPEIFVYAHQFLDRTLGGVNTLVLILSSFTMAAAVRAAQLGRQRALVALLATTLICAFAFLGIKGIEYEHKWKHGLLWGKRYQPEEARAQVTGTAHGPSEAEAAARALEPEQTEATSDPLEPPADQTQAPTGPANAPPVPADELERRSAIAPARPGPQGLAGERGADVEAIARPVGPPKNVWIFFGIYFVMTGLHAVHVIAGMGIIGWLLVRASRGAFTAAYFTPVDLGGLYWHLVDLIWIFLFPLLYLIH